MSQITIDHIESQHDGLFALLSDTKFAIVNGDDFISILTLLGRLEQYVYEHFRDEEEFMRSTNFPDYEKHKRTHDGFRELVTRVVDDMSLSGTPSVDVVGMVEKWLRGHTSKEMKLFVDNLNTSPI